MARIGYCIKGSADDLQDAAREASVPLDHLEEEDDPVGRPALRRLARVAGPADEVVVPDLQSLGELLAEVEANVSMLLIGRAAIRVLDGPVVIRDLADDGPMQMLRLAARLARESDRQRLRGDVDHAEGAGHFRKGRPRSVNERAIFELRAQGLGATAIARQLGVARWTVYRYLDRLDQTAPTPRVRPKRGPEQALAPDSPLAAVVGRAGRGRPKVGDDKQILEMAAAGMGTAEIARRLSISKATVARRLKAAEVRQPLRAAE